MTTSPQNQEQQEQTKPSPSDVKQSIDKKETNQKQANGKVIRKAVGKQSKRKWGLFGLRATSAGLEEGAKTFELTMLKMRLDKESEILEEYELSPEELAEMTSD